MTRKTYGLFPVTAGIACAVLVIALSGCEMTPTEIADGAATAQLAKGGKPGGGEEPGAYTLTDLGVGSASSITAAGVIVGTLGPCCSGEPTIWGLDRTPAPLGKLGGTGTYPYSINPAGTKVVGEWWVSGGAGMRPVFWKLSGTDVIDSGFLTPVDGRTGGQAYAVNDAGAAVGVSGEVEASLATFWDPDGTPRALGTSPERPQSFAVSVNNSGLAVGSANPADPHSGLWSHAYLWIVAGGDVTTVDLTLDADETGWNMARGVSEVVGGFAKIVGETTVAGERFATVWTVDATTGSIVDVRREPDLQNAFDVRDINAGGQVILGIEGISHVWDTGSDALTSLPSLSGGRFSCGSVAYEINDGGTVVGRSLVRSKGSCEDHAVVWTPNVP